MKMNSKFAWCRRWVSHTAVILALVLILSLMAVSGPLSVNAAASSTSIVSGGVIQHPYLTIQFQKQGVPASIRPGMSKQQVDKLLGTPAVVESDSFRGYFYSMASLMIGYLDGRVASIATSTTEASLNGLFKRGTPGTKVLAKLGQPSQKNDLRYEYVFQITNGKLKQIYGQAVPLSKGRSDVYTLRFTVKSNGNIIGISVQQSAFTQAMEDRINKPDPNRSAFAVEDIIGISSGGDKRISLGMNRETVEEKYGKPDGQLSYGMAVMDTYGTISVFYRDEIVAAILVDPKADTQTNKGLRMPASRNEVLRMYGEPTSSESSGLEYHFEQVGAQLQSMNFYRWADSKYHRNNLYSLSFVAYEDDSNRIEYFILNDFDFIYDEMNIPKPATV